MVYEHRYDRPFKEVYIQEPSKSLFLHFSPVFFLLDCNGHHNPWRRNPPSRFSGRPSIPWCMWYFLMSIKPSQLSAGNRWHSECCPSPQSIFYPKNLLFFLYLFQEFTLYEASLLLLVRERKNNWTCCSGANKNGTGKVGGATKKGYYFSLKTWLFSLNASRWKKDNICT